MTLEQRQATRRDDELEIYIHVPFCSSKCRFCFYVSFAGSDGKRRREYLQCLERETEYRWSRLQRRPRRINSLYVGGGTPSCLLRGEWEQLTSVVRRFWDIDRVAEVTVECNPSSTTADTLASLVAFGANRISLGVQSIDASLLARLGRQAPSERIGNVVGRIRANGFTNINCDVLIGLPGETEASVESTLETLVGMGIPHISVYPFLLRPTAELYGDEGERSACMAARTWRSTRFQCSAAYLLARGYQRTSTTHFALDPAYECIHHRNYWDGGNVLGLGVAAQSFIGNSLSTNVSDLAEYGRLVPDRTDATTISLSRRDVFRRWALMGLSKKGHLSYSAFALRFGSEATADLDQELSVLFERGWIAATRTEARLTEIGTSQSHALAAVLPFDSDAYWRRAMRLPARGAIRVKR